MEETKKIKSFTDLVAQKESHKLALLIYQITKNFPSSEIHSLTDQIRRAAVSISSNIAEGFSRQSRKEKIQFYYTSKGSLTELQNQLLLSKDLGYMDKETFNKIASQTVVTDRLIVGLIKFIKSQT